MDVKGTTGNANQMMIVVLNIVVIFYQDLTYLVIRVFVETKNITNNIAPNFIPRIKSIMKTYCTTYSMDKMYTSPHFIFV